MLVMPVLDTYIDLDEMCDPARCPGGRDLLKLPEMKHALRNLLVRVRTGKQPRDNAGHPAAAAAAAAELAPAADDQDSPAPPQWVHGDLRLANVLGPKDGGITGRVDLYIIDPDWAGTHGVSLYQQSYIQSQLHETVRRPPGVSHKMPMYAEHDSHTLHADYSRCGEQLDIPSPQLD